MVLDVFHNVRVERHVVIAQVAVVRVVVLHLWDGRRGVVLDLELVLELRWVLAGAGEAAVEDLRADRCLLLVVMVSAEGRRRRRGL